MESHFHGASSQIKKGPLKLEVLDKCRLHVSAVMDKHDLGIAFLQQTERDNFPIPRSYLLVAHGFLIDTTISCNLTAPWRPYSHTTGVIIIIRLLASGAHANPAVQT